MNLEVHYFKDREGRWCARADWSEWKADADGQALPVPRRATVKSPFNGLAHAMLYLAEPIAKAVEG